MPSIPLGSEKLVDIQFPEFTAKLLTDTFDAIIAANLRQTESYIELVGAMSKTLTAYIDDTKASVSGDEILGFLGTVLPPTDATHSSKVAEGLELTSDDAGTLSLALTVPGESAPTVKSSSSLTKDALKEIAALVARRLAASRYNLLKEMVKMGLLRLVVTDGKVVTQLTFSTWASSVFQKNSSSYNTSNFTLNANAQTGKALSKWFSASASTKYQTVSVRTANESQSDISGSSVNIFGRVEVNFRTDFMPLAQLEPTEKVAKAASPPPPVGVAEL